MAVHASRRRFLGTTSVFSAGLLSSFGNRVLGAPSAKIESIEVISRQPNLYCGWPTLVRRSVDDLDELILVWSGGREAHVCPFGRVEMMRSRDAGRSWSFPRVLIDGPIDDRDAGALVTRDGTILVTTFTSLAFEPGLAKAEAASQSGKAVWSDAKLARWLAARDRVAPEQRQEQLGNWMVRSTDGGLEWSGRYRVPLNSPHGPVQLADGRLLYAGKALWTTDARVGVCESRDDGRSWQWLATIPTRKGDDHRQYHELHAVETTAGRLIAHIRNHNNPNARETLQTESEDGGKTWTEPHPIGVWGLPSHLLRLRDGRLLMSYGHRRAPLGNQVRVSEDDGRSWSDPILISSDAKSGDLGYPSTVELKDGTLVTVWYELRPGNSNSVLRQARWRLAE